MQSYDPDEWTNTAHMHQHRSKLCELHETTNNAVMRPRWVNQYGTHTHQHRPKLCETHETVNNTSCDPDEWANTPHTSQQRSKLCDKHETVNWHSINMKSWTDRSHYQQAWAKIKVQNIVQWASIGTQIILIFTKARVEQLQIFHSSQQVAACRKESPTTKSPERCWPGGKIVPQIW
jgi:hypothetical protein